MSGPFEEKVAKELTVPMGRVRLKPGAYKSRTAEEARTVADMMGQKVVVPEPNQLFVDIDNIHAFRVFMKGIPLVMSRHPGEWSCRPSPSGEPWHLHVTVTFDEHKPSAFERILLQAALGSDPMREVLSYIELLDGREHPTIFFEKKDGA